MNKIQRQTGQRGKVVVHDWPRFKVHSVSLDISFHVVNVYLVLIVIHM